MYITLQEWLNIFKSPKINFQNFKKSVKVRKNNGDILKLSSYKTLPIPFYKKIYSIMVLDKEKYLINFYNKSLKIIENNYPICLKNNKFIQYKNIIRNLYYKEILQETNTIQPNTRNYLDVIIDLFKNNIIDYKLLTPSVMKYIQNNSIGPMLSGLFFRASIMNPIIPYSLSTHMNYKFKVLTPTLGWSSYLTGMLQNKNMIEYVGIDVIPKVCDTTRQLALQNNLKNEIFCVPSEDLYTNKSFMTKYTNYFDFIFFSPPYYELELYKGEEQSTNRYENYEEWLEKYWRTTIKLCKKCIKKDRLLIYILSGYKLKNNYINLEEDMNNITKEEGFLFIDGINMVGSNVNFTKHRGSNEIIWIFSSGSKKNIKNIKNMTNCNLLNIYKKKINKQIIF